MAYSADYEFLRCIISKFKFNLVINLSACSSSSWLVTAHGTSSSHTPLLGPSGKFLHTLLWMTICNLCRCIASTYNTLCTQMHINSIRGFQ